MLGDQLPLKLKLDELLKKLMTTEYHQQQQQQQPIQQMIHQLLLQHQAQSITFTQLTVPTVQLTHKRNGTVKCDPIQTTSCLE